MATDTVPVFDKASRRWRSLLFCIVGTSLRPTSLSLLNVAPVNSSVESASAMHMASFASEGKNILAKATA
jgi:hypothetical protein